MIKKIIKKIANKFGVDIVKLRSFNNFNNPYFQYSRVNKNIIDIEILGKMSLCIPGMITPEAGKFLYSLCYMQDLKGDVVEIGMQTLDIGKTSCTLTCEVRSLHADKVVLTIDRIVYVRVNKYGLPKGHGWMSKDD